MSSRSGAEVTRNRATTFVAFCDPAGHGHDEFTLAVVAVMGQRGARRFVHAAMHVAPKGRTQDMAGESRGRTGLEDVDIGSGAGVRRASRGIATGWGGRAGGQAAHVLRHYSDWRG